MSGLNVFDWMEKVRSNRAGISFSEKAALKSMRSRVLKRANTTWNTLLIAKSRQAIGEALYNSIKVATQEEQEGYRVTVEHKDMKIVTPDKMAASMVKDAIKKLTAARNLADKAIKKLSYL